MVAGRWGAAGAKIAVPDPVSGFYAGSFGESYSIRSGTGQGPPAGSRSAWCLGRDPNRVGAWDVARLAIDYRSMPSDAA
jgi:hypothetical protein